MKPVRQRLVIFIRGFDPRGASSFYQGHKASCAEHSERHGGAYKFSPRIQSHKYSHTWTVQSELADGAVSTQFEYLAWDDLVRTQWTRTAGAVVRQAWDCLKAFVATGTIMRMHRMSKSVVRAALFPYFLVACTVAVVLLLSACAVAAAYYVGLASTLVGCLGASVMLATGWAAFRWLQSVPSTRFLRVISFARDFASADRADHPMQIRLQDWSCHLDTQLKISTADEILLIGYSAGTILSMALMARLVREMPEVAKRITLITLGNSIPATAGLPNAEHVRADLRALGRANVFWLDISSPIDWGSFPLNDTVTSIAGGGASNHRQHLSPQWHLLFCTPSYQKLKKDKYRVHDQYLLTTEVLGRYDYFAITCGPMSIHQRFFTN
jgi:hypothetical protein